MVNSLSTVIGIMEPTVDFTKETIRKESDAPLPPLFKQHGSSRISIRACPERPAPLNPQQREPLIYWCAICRK